MKKTFNVQLSTLNVGREQLNVERLLW